MQIKILWNSKLQFVSCSGDFNVQGGSNMTRTDLYVNKPQCAAAVRPWESEATTSTLPPARVRTCSVLSGSCKSDERTEGTAERGTTHCDQIPRWRKRPGTFCSLITLATPRQEWTGSNPSRREGGGCGFILSRSHSCCAVRLVYT